MFSERPSQRKVVGVARKYLRREEAAERAIRDIERIKFEEMGFGELYGTSYSLGFIALGHLATSPLHRQRRNFLQQELDIQGWTPGDENLNNFALRAANVPERRFPLIRSSLHNY